ERPGDVGAHPVEARGRAVRRRLLEGASHAHDAPTEPKTAIVIGRPVLILIASMRGPALWRSPRASARWAKLLSSCASIKTKRHSPPRRNSTAPKVSARRVVVPARKTKLGS